MKRFKVWICKKLNLKQRTPPKYKMGDIVDIGYTHAKVLDYMEEASNCYGTCWLYLLEFTPNPSHSIGARIREGMKIWLSGKHIKPVEQGETRETCALALKGEG